MGWTERPTEVYFRVTGADVPSEASPELVAACHMIPCMSKGLPLHVAAPLTGRLAGDPPPVLTLLSEWNRTLRPVRVVCDQAAATIPSPASKRGVAACFTGGVDSFHTLISRNDEIEALVYVLGFDLTPKQTQLWDRVQKMLRAVAAHYGKQLVVVDTNLRQLLDRALPWGMTHGTALAAVGHLLSGQYKRLIIPSSFAESQIYPWGSHPQLDSLWSSDAMEIVHDGITVNRLEKLRNLTDAGVPLDYLRVCWENPGEAFNCGHCMKCFRTMAGLTALGALERATTFPKEIDVTTAGRLDMGDQGDGYFFLEVADELKRTGREPKLEAFLRLLPGTQRATSSITLIAAEQANHVRKEPLRIRSARVEVSQSSTTVRVPVQWGAIESELRVEFGLGGTPPAEVGDALLLWFILPAMWHCVPLILEDAVSPELLDGVRQAQGFWASHAGFKGLSVVEITAPTAEREPDASASDTQPWAAAFSSSVDAMFTAMTGTDRLRYLVWIDGLESEAVDRDAIRKSQTRLNEAAAALGKELLIVRANFRGVLFRELGLAWHFMYIIAPYGLAHLLQAHISRFLIGSAQSYREMFTPGLMLRYHPVLDRMLSSRRVGIKLHGMTHSRFQKIESLAELRPDLLDYLIVCLKVASEDNGARRNCGRCEKCLRTLVAIRLAAPHRPAVAFDCPLDLKRLAAVAEGYLFYPELLDEAERRGEDPALCAAVRTVVSRGMRRMEIPGELLSPVEALRAAPSWPRLVREHAAAIAAAVTADRPASRLRDLLADPPEPELDRKLLRALFLDQGRGRLLRRVLEKCLLPGRPKGGAR